MPSSRTSVVILILIGGISAAAGIFGNVAASALSTDLQPYLWLAWPLFILFTAAGIGLAVWQVRQDQRAHPPAQPQPTDPPTVLSATATPPNPLSPRPTKLPVSQSTSLPAQGPAGNDFDYDVFISYSSADKTWVRGELLSALEQAGLRVCIDFRDFQPGAPSVTEMERAVQTSRRTLLVLTPAYLASAWTEFEALMLQTLDAANRQRRLIPLLLERCDLPVRIGYLTYVNFVDPDDPAWAWTQLLTALGAAPLQETMQPSTPAGWLLAHPYAMPPNFTGRRAERTELSQWLEQDSQHPLLVICALGGFGKSALAWHWLLHDVDAAAWPRVVWWSFYEPEATVERFLAETLAYLGVDPRRYPGPRQQADALLSLLRQPGTLLLLDGFERALRAYSSMMAAYQGDEVAGGKLQVAGGQVDSTDTPSGINHSQLPIDHSQLDCVSPIAEHFLRSLASLPGLRGKVLMTTRLVPRVLQAHDGDLLLGCREIELTQMQPADAVAFFRSQGIRGGRAEIEAACAPYGYHPLSLRLLAGWIKKDMQQPGDIVAARRLDVSGDLVQRRHHVLETAYGSLLPAQQQLLSRIACFRGPVGYEALAAVAAQSQKSDFFSGKPSLVGRLFGRNERVREDKKPGFSLDAALPDLIDRGLLHRDLKTNRFDLHPIVRRYAYDRLAGDQRSAAHAQLRDYFAAVPPVERVQTLDDLAPVIELYHHTLAAGQYDEAWVLYRDRLWKTIYYQLGAYQMQIELLRSLFRDGENRPPTLNNEAHQDHAMNELANSYSLSGQPRRAVPLFETINASFEKRGDKHNLAIGLGNLADGQAKIGALRAAEANLRRRIELCREIEDEFDEAIGHQELGPLLAYRGAWDEAEGELAAALAITAWNENPQGHGVNWAYRTLGALLFMRAVPLTSDPVRSPLSDSEGSRPEGEWDRRRSDTTFRAGEGRGVRGDLVTSALHAARRALELADETARTRYPNPVDYVRAYWLLGAACRANSDPAAADRHLTEALTRCRGINLVEFEANILLDLARLRRDAAQTGGSFGPGPQDDRMGEPLRLAQEALAIAERSGYVLQGADVRLFLAQLALDAGDRAAALAHVRQARRLAACDGPPDYTYKVAYDEAGALLDVLDDEAAK